MNTQYSLSALIGVARTLGRSHNIDVSVSGNSAFTGRDDAGKYHINIPVLAEDPHAFDLARGYIDHESGHALLTDMDAEKRISIPDTMRGALHHIFNIVEDGRIERKMASLYPGCKRNLARLNDLLMGQDDKTPARDPWAKIVNWILLETLAQNQDSMRPLADKARRKIDGALAAAILPDIQSAVACSDSSACVNHAVNILNVVQRYAQGGQDQNSQGGQDQNSQGGQDQNSQGAKIIKGMERDAGDSEKEKALQEALHNAADSNAACDENAKHASALSAGIGHSHFYPTSDLTDKDLHAALSASVQLSARMQTLLQALTTERRAPSRRGRLNTRALHRSSFDSRLFLSRSQAIRLNTEVILLCDVSGSMYGPRIDLASQSIYAIMHCLRRMQGITSSVYQYDDVCECVLPTNKTMTRRMHLETAGGTSTGAALLFTMQKFGHDRTRRILIVLTDGSTGDPGLMQKAVYAAQEMGIELYGLGMQTDYLNAFPSLRSQAINNMNDLTGALFSLLREGIFHA